MLTDCLLVLELTLITNNFQTLAVPSPLQVIKNLPFLDHLVVVVVVAVVVVIMKYNVSINYHYLYHHHLYNHYNDNLPNTIYRCIVCTIQ